MTDQNRRPLSYLSHQYTTDDFKDVRVRLKKICDGWFNSEQRPARLLVDEIILDLRKQGYRIVKTGVQ